MSQQRESGNVRLRICFLSYYELPRSPNTATYNRLTYLSRHHDVYFITTADAFIPEPVRGSARIHRMPIPVPKVPGDFEHVLGLTFFSLHVISKVVCLHLRAPLDFIYTFHNPECLVAWLLKKMGLRWVADILDLPHLNAADQDYLRKERRFYFPSLRRALLMMMKKAIPEADLVITTALSRDHGFAKVLVEDFNVAVDRLFPVPNGINLSLFQPIHVPYKNDTFTVLYVGFVSPRRGVDTLLQACAFASTCVPNLCLQLIGPSKQEDRDWLNGEIAKLCMQAHVHYMGSQEHYQVLELIRSADVCVYPFPANLELDGVLPIKIFEYLASGRPVVATRLSGVGRLIDHERNGLLVEPESPQEMAEAIIRLYSDEELRSQLEHNARLSVEPFDWNGILAKIEKRMLQVARAE